MPISLPKKKATPVEEEVADDLGFVEVLQSIAPDTLYEVPKENLEARLDQVIALEDQVAAAKQFIAEHDKMRKSLISDILDEAEDVDDDEEFEFTSNDGIMEFGKKANNRKIVDMDEVRKLMGPEQFMECASVKLKDIDDYLTPKQREKVLEVVRGDRSVKIEKKYVG